MDNFWTPELAKTSAVLAVLFTVVAVYALRRDKTMMLIVCFFIFYGFIYRPAEQMQQQECERAKVQLLQKSQPVNRLLSKPGNSGNYSPH